MWWASLGEQEGDAICTGRLTVAPEGSLGILSQAREEVKRLEWKKGGERAMVSLGVAT